MGTSESAKSALNGCEKDRGWQLMSLSMTILSGDSEGVGEEVTGTVGGERGDNVAQTWSVGGGPRRVAIVCPESYVGGDERVELRRDAG